MRERDPQDPMATEPPPPPYGEPEGPVPPSRWERLVEWFMRTPTKTKYSLRGSKEVPKSRLVRQVRIIFTILGVLHGAIGLALLWFGLFFEPTSSRIWMPAWGLSGFGALFLLIAFATFLED